MAAISTGRRIPERQPTLNTPDPSYHGAVWTEAVKPLGPIAYIIKARVTLLRDLGAAMSPFNAFQFLQGLETLPLRIARHCAERGRGRGLPRQAARRSRRSSTPACRPAMPSASAPTRISRAAMAVWSASSWQAGREAGRRFIDALKLFYHVANIGDARSLAIHPATTTHSQLSPEDQAADRRDATAMCACRSASSTSTTSSPTSSVALPPPARWPRRRERGGVIEGGRRGVAGRAV